MKDMEIKDEKPPGDMDSGTRFLSTHDSLAGRFKNFGELVGDWRVCPVRTSLHSRCLIVLENIQEVKKCVGGT